MRSKTLLRWIGVVMALMLVAAACGDDDDDTAETTAGDETEETAEPAGEPEPTAGFDGETITLGAITPTTGVAAVIGNPLTRGNQVYFQALNEEEGGVAGQYPVELEVVDSQYDPPTGVQQYTRLKGNVAAFVQILGTAVVNAVLPQLEQDDILAGPASLDSFWVREQNLLHIGGPYQTQAINAMDWWINQEGNADSTVCFMGQDDPYGDAGLRGLEFAAEQFDFEIATQARFAPTDTEFGAQVGQLQGAGCELVFLTGLPSHTGGIIGAAASSNYAPHWIGQSPTWVNVLAAAPIADYLAANFTLVAEGPEWGDTSSEGMAQMIEDVEAYAADQGPDIYFAFGYAEAWAMHQVLEQAVEMGDLSREGIIEAMNSIDTLEFGDLLGDYDYGPPEERVPPRASRMFEIVPGQENPLVALTDSFASDEAEAFEFE